MSAVTRAMTMFNEEYPGKFSLGTKTTDSDDPSRVKVWKHVLREFSDEIILHAALHLVAIRPDWPPDVATMREQCVLMANGQSELPNGADAWGLLMDHVSHVNVELGDTHKEALKQTGLTVRDLRSVNVSNIPTIRSQFVKSFDSIVQKKHRERITLPEVKALTSNNAPALPEPEPKQLEENAGESEIMSLEDAKKEFGSAMQSLCQMLKE